MQIAWKVSDLLVNGGVSRFREYLSTTEAKYTAPPADGTREGPQISRTAFEGFTGSLDAPSILSNLSWCSEPHCKDFGIGVSMEFVVIVHEINVQARNTEYV